MQNLTIGYRYLCSSTGNFFDDKISLICSKVETEQIRKNIVNDGVQSLNKYTNQKVSKINYIKIENEND